MHILSPFDPLIIQRKRTELFFGYGHRFEAYVPKEKRLFGYFALPVLVGEDIVAAIDLKTDRQNRKLLMQKWSWVGKGAAKGARKDYKRRIEEELRSFRAVSAGGVGFRSGTRRGRARRRPHPGLTPPQQALRSRNARVTPARASCVASGDNPPRPAGSR